MVRTPNDPYDEVPKAAADVVYGNMNNPDYRGQPQPSESFFTRGEQAKQASWVDSFYPSMRTEHPKPAVPATQLDRRTNSYRAAPNQYASAADGPAVELVMAKAPGRKAPSAPAQAPHPGPPPAPQPPAFPDKPLYTRDRKSIINPAILALIGKKENEDATEKQRYEARNEKGAVGKYQFTTIALQDIGYLDKKGNWTQKAADRGIRSLEDLRRNPAAQEVAAEEYFNNQEEYVRNLGELRHLGQEITGIGGQEHPGVIEPTFPITEGGLIAAAHRQGVKVLRMYLEHQKRNGWKSDFSNIDPKVQEALRSEPDPKTGKVITAEDRFRRIEKRIREFAQTPYRMWVGD